MSKSELFEAMRQEQPGGLANVGAAANPQAQVPRAPLATLLDSAATADLRPSWKEPPAAPQPLRDGAPPPPQGRPARSASADAAAGHGARHVIVDDDGDDDSGDDTPPKLVVPHLPPVLPQLPMLPTSMADASAKTQRPGAVRQGPAEGLARKAPASPAVEARPPPPTPLAGMKSMFDRPARPKPSEAMRQLPPGAPGSQLPLAKATPGRPLAARLDNAGSAKSQTSWKELPGAQRSAKERAALSRPGQATQTATRGAVQSKSQTRSSSDGDGGPPPRAASATTPGAAGALPPSLPPSPSTPAQRSALRSQDANAASAVDSRNAAASVAIAGLHRADPAAVHDPLARIDTPPLPDDDATDLAFDAADLASYLVALNPETYAALQRTCTSAVRSIAKFAIDSCGGAGRVNAVALRRMLKNGVLRVDMQGRPTVALQPGGVATALAARSLAAALQRSCGVTAAGCPQPGCGLGTLDLPMAVVAAMADNKS